VKPGNLLVRDDGSVKITDFGIAWSARSVALTRTGQVIGTPQYLSPEQAEGKLATPASDVYALGLIGYECLTGHPAFEGDNAVTIALKQVQQEPEPLPGALPPGVRTLISRALVKNPAARIPDGAAFGAAIDDVLAGRELPEAPLAATRQVAALPLPHGDGGAPTAGTAVLTPPAPRRGRRLAMALLPLVALLAGAGIAAGVLQTISDSPPASTAVAAEQRDSGSVLLRAADHVGRPVDEVAEELTALGLVVELKAEPTSAVPADQVTGISPTGRQLRAGDVVVVRYAVPLPRTGSSTRTGTVPREALVTAPAPGADDTTGEVVTEAPTSSAPTLEARGPSPTPTDPTAEPVTPVTPTEPTTPLTPTDPTEPTTPTTEPTTTPEPSTPEPSTSEPSTSEPSTSTSTSTSPEPSTSTSTTTSASTQI